MGVKDLIPLCGGRVTAVIPNRVVGAGHRVAVDGPPLVHYAPGMNAKAVALSGDFSGARATFLEQVSELKSWGSRKHHVLVVFDGYRPPWKLAINQRDKKAREAAAGGVPRMPDDFMAELGWAWFC